MLGEERGEGRERFVLSKVEKEGVRRERERRCVCKREGGKVRIHTALFVWLRRFGS